MSLLNDRIEAIIEIAKKDPEVLAVILFGSLARGEAVEASDIDICLLLVPGQFDSPLKLSQKKLTYRRFSDCDIQVYQQLPLYIKKRVLKEGQVLFCRDEESLYDVAFQTIRQFEDFRHIYHSYLEAVEHDQ